MSNDQGVVVIAGGSVSLAEPVLPRTAMEELRQQRRGESTIFIDEQFRVRVLPILFTTRVHVKAVFSTILAGNNKSTTTVRRPE